MKYTLLELTIFISNWIASYTTDKIKEYLYEYL